MDKGESVMRPDYSGEKPTAEETEVKVEEREEAVAEKGRKNFEETSEDEG